MSDTIILDAAATFDSLADLQAHHRRVIDQRNKDWDALMIEIALTVGDADDREAAEMGEIEEFDPWHALRKCRAESVAVTHVYEAALRYYRSCTGKHADEPNDEHGVFMDAISSALQQAKGTP